jgi:methionyl-tRNA formyltransferase
MREAVRIKSCRFVLFSWVHPILRCQVFRLWPLREPIKLLAPPVKNLALELDIPIMQPEKLRTPESMQQLSVWNPDLIIVAAFGQILKKDVLDLPRYGCINVHASLLPRWRGAAPINAAILAGDEETGVTIMQMDVGLDLQALSTLGADLLLETLPEYLSGNLKPIPQPAEGATYAPMLKKEDGKLDFTKDVNELERRVRAMNPWPGAWFEWNGNPLKVLRASVISGEKGLLNGNRFTIEGRPAIMSADDALALDEVQPAGKKIMSGKSFLAGAREWV